MALPTLHRRTGQLHAMVDMNLNHIRALSTPGIGVVVISPAVGAGMALEIMVPVHIEEQLIRDITGTLRQITRDAIDSEINSKGA